MGRGSAKGSSPKKKQSSKKRTAETPRLSPKRASQECGQGCATPPLFESKLKVGVARHHRELSEAQARQTAMAQILEVISSSPGDLTPVFDAILEKATLLCGASFSALAIHKGGDMHEVVALRGAPPALPEMLQQPVPLAPRRGWAASCAAKASFISPTPRTTKATGSATPCVSPWST